MKVKAATLLDPITSARIETLSVTCNRNVYRPLRRKARQESNRAAVEVRRMMVWSFRLTEMFRNDGITLSSLLALPRASSLRPRAQPNSCLEKDPSAGNPLNLLDIPGSSWAMGGRVTKFRHSVRTPPTPSARPCLEFGHVL